ncbi:cyclic lactone autoinducer peptide [Clostridium sp. YIM B02505]|uniref:Cyclic lactone autoinducer peptide n=1 Tax=Clostridium yunnanense TaxID=2800325 RepID=A0ABS1EKM6_9CLOT|nr:cyclic lactone autoinducer peptide [Clostridium yunnanense]MBK1809914.1 cyclic lactone autoinducer peptide [Clostridium yunnanense]
MNNMKNKVFEKLARTVGEASIKISDKATGKCMMGYLYEPKAMLEIIKNNNK